MNPAAAPEIGIRPYLAADRDACLAIFRGNLPRYFDESELPEFEAFLHQPVGEYFVIDLAGAVVACGGCYFQNGTGRLSWGMVWHQYHRRAIGETLLAWRVSHLFSQDDISEISIDTSQHTAGFFARYGFRAKQQVADGFGRGIDQISMFLLRAEWLAPANQPPRPTAFGVD